MQKRVLSAVVLIPIVIIFIYFAPLLAWFVLVELIGLGALSEYHNLVPDGMEQNDRIFCYIVNLLAVLIVFITESVSLAAFSSFALIAIYHIIQKEEHSEIISNFLRDILGMFYCAILPSYIMMIRALNGRSYIYLLLITIWAIDSAAYYVGSTIGKNKLIPSISPNKTIEGSIGGTVAAIGVMIGAKILYFTNFSFNEAVIFGLILSVMSQFGDLFESLLKRAKGIKDSGNLIPGHGGMLDRIDSLLFSAPTFFYFTLILNL